jgi:hypothetical protein
VNVVCFIQNTYLTHPHSRSSPYAMQPFTQLPSTKLNSLFSRG